MGELLVVVVDGVVLAVEKDVGVALVDERFGKSKRTSRTPKTPGMPLPQLLL